ncbi:MAG: DUF4886 domain-containing protein [Lentisphaerae bacterium]|nr:DUF4886 domain-containing protein [Lentisphaerota bacterium]
MWKKFLLAVIAATAVSGSLMAKELKVLMIGNSFSISVGRFLPQIVGADPENKLILTSAYIGGCPLEKHYNCLVKAQEKPSYAPYKITVWDSENNPAKGNAVMGNIYTLLRDNQYDIITIQQSSPNSISFKTFEPYAGNLIKYIREHQKNAEIIVHQTWAYRIDCPRLPAWGLTQQSMYEKVNKAYRELAEKYRLRVIPVGDAIQIFRATTPVKYKPLDPTVKYVEPELPDTSGDVVGLSLWQTTKQKGRHIHHDSTHLNEHGKYLQAAVWYLFLFDRKASDIKFIPEIIKKKDALFLQNCAAQAVEAYQQVK